MNHIALRWVNNHQENLPLNEKITPEILSECLNNSNCQLEIIRIDSNHKVFIL